MKRICQIKKLINCILFSTLIVTFGCSQVPIGPEVAKIPGKWFDTKDEFRLQDAELDVVVNYFFDPVGEFNIETGMADIVVTNWANSENKFSFDILSGQKFYEAKYCKESDVWKGYKSKIYLPPYSVGFVPRLLDQSKKEQKVLLFGEHYKKSSRVTEDRYYLSSVKVRIIGGIIEQSCPHFPCDEPSKWDSRIVLLAVDPTDPAFGDVKSIGALTKKVDFDYVKAFMENGDGRIVIQDIEYPAYKTFGDVVATKAMKFAIDKGHLFSNKEMSTLRNSCEFLYLKMRDDREKLLNKEMDFADYFREFYNNESKNFLTCAEFVKFPKNTFDSDLFWYFEFFHTYFLAVKRNYVFDCASRTWMRNYRVENGKLAYNTQRELRMCSTKNLNEAFDSSISVLSSMQNSGSEFYSFIEYDSGVEGTSNKFYNFVKKSGKRQSCNEEERSNLIFPSDVSWRAMPEKEVENIQIYKGKKNK